MLVRSSLKRRASSRERCGPAGARTAVVMACVSEAVRSSSASAADCETVW